jgi:thymidylate kinase
MVRRHRPSFLRRRWDDAAQYADAMKRAIRSPGLSVALLGPDGAGKSTLAAGISQSFKMPVSIMYMGLTGGFLKQVARLRVPGVVFVGRAMVIWRRYLRGRLHQARGRLVVFDRYVLDAAVPHPLRLTRLQRMSRWLDFYLCPPPDLVLVLDAPGDVMHRRKGEYHAQMLEDWRRHFRELQRRFPDVVEIVDASQEKDAVRIDATQRICAAIARARSNKWAGCRNCPLGVNSDLRRTARFRRFHRLSPMSRRFGYDRGLPLDRHYIEQFLSRESAAIRGQVLECGGNRTSNPR